MIFRVILIALALLISSSTALAAAPKEIRLIYGSALSGEVSPCG